MPSFNFFKFLKRKFSGSIPSTEENNETTNNEENEEKTFKMVLMGNSSGKSTLFKQFGKLKVTNYLKDEEELKNYKGIIYYNILQSLCYLIECVRSKDEEFTNKELVDNFLNNFTDDFIKYSSAKYWTGNLFEMIEKIYNNEPILQDLLKSDNITTDYFGRNLIYYMKHFNRIKQDNYIPTFQDILNIKNKTTGIVELKFTHNYNLNNNVNYLLYDLGGGRNERKKWIHTLCDCNLIIFTVALDQYYMRCYEDDSTNRVKESLFLFEETFHSHLLKNVKKVLIFTKVDLFVEKVNEGVFIDKYFEEFKGNKYNVTDTFEFILNLFKNEYKDNFLQYHVVNLLDSKECSDCIDCILNQSGRFISPLLLKSLQKNSYKIILFKSLMNENLCDVEIIIE